MIPSTRSNIKNEYQVVIVGCGPNGAVMANLLGMYGVSTLIVEYNKEICTTPRAAHLDDEGIRVLQSIGLDTIVKENSYELDVQFNRFHNNSTFLDIKNETLETGHPRSIFWYQPKLENILVDGLKRFSDHVQLVTNHQVKQHHYDPETGLSTVKIIDRDNSHSIITTRCKFIIGADGGNSWVRKSINSKFIGESGSSKWLVVDVFLHDDHPKLNNCFQFVIDPTNPMICLPIPGNHYRWEFVANQDSSIEELESDEYVTKRIVMGGGDPSKLTIKRRSAYTFHNRTADNWYNGENVLLIGDAAHCLPPFLGMGLSSGFRDCHNLAWKLDLICRGVSDTSILSSYMSERRPEIELIGKNSSGVGNIIMSKSKVLVTIRDFIFTLLMTFPFMKAMAEKAGMKPVVPLSSGLIDTKSSVDGTKKQLKDRIEKVEWDSIQSLLVLFISVVLILGNEVIVLCSRFFRKESTRVGHRIVQPNVSINTNNIMYQTSSSPSLTNSPSISIDRFDNVKGKGFTCLLFNNQNDVDNHNNIYSILTELDLSNSIWNQLDTKFICVNNNNNQLDSPVNNNLLLDNNTELPITYIQDNSSNELFKFFNVPTNSQSNNSTIIIVRPDNVVFGVYNGNNIHSIIPRLKLNLQTLN